MVSDKLLRQFAEDEKRRRGIEPSASPKPSMLGSAIGSVAQTVDDAARAFSNALTFGQADRLAKAMPEWLGGEPDAYARSAAARERSPNVSRVAGIAGAAVPASKIGLAASKIIPAAARTIPGVLGLGALEGGTFSAANQLGEKGVMDPTRTISDIAMGALGILGPSGRIAAIKPATQATSFLTEPPEPTEIINRAGKSDRLQVPNRKKKKPLAY